MGLVARPHCHREDLELVQLGGAVGITILASKATSDIFVGSALRTTCAPPIVGLGAGAGGDEPGEVVDSPLAVPSLVRLMHTYGATNNRRVHDGGFYVSTAPADRLEAAVSVAVRREDQADSIRREIIIY